MIWSTPVLLAALVFGLKYFVEYRDWIGISKKVTFRTAPGPCKVVIEEHGSEDVTHIGNNIILITQGFDLHNSVGSMMALDLATNDVVTLNMTNIPSRPDFMASPHGMTTWRDPDTDELFVYVLTHPVPEDRIEVFLVTKALSLNYVKTITDPSFIFMNDLVAVGKDQFYITKFWRSRQKAYIVAESLARLHSGGVIILFMNDLVAVGKDQFYITKFWRSRQKAYIVAESLARLHSGGVMYYDGRRAREVATGYFLSNGINISPDKSMVYVAEFGTGVLHGFHREPTNNLVKAWEYDTETQVDNIEVDPATGDLWIGCHPMLYKILDFYHFMGYTNPSQVIRVKLRDNAISAVEQIYSDDGHELVGSTAATYVNGKLVIGSVGNEAVVCDVKYLSQ